MPRVYGITIPAGLEIIYNKTLKMYDISVFCNIGKNRRFFSRKNRYNLKQFTKLYAVASAWSSLNQTEKDNWYSAGNASGINGYALYTQDRIYRLMNSLVGSATPSIFHQYKVAHIKIDSPATSAQYTERHITPIALPATLDVNYYSDLVSAGPGAYAKIIVSYMRFYSGKNIVETFEIPLDLSSAWKAANVNVPISEGIAGNWSISIKLYNVTGDLYFDNLFFKFNGTIQNHDPFCDFFPKYFNLDNVPAGVSAESLYCPDSIN